MQWRGLGAKLPEAVQQFSFRPARDARVNGQHQKATLLKASGEALLDRGGVGEFGTGAVAGGPHGELGGMTREHRRGAGRLRAAQG